MGAPSWPLLAVSVFVLVAGCTDGGTPAATGSQTPAPSADVTPETGSLTGRVVDDELAPINGADVAAVGPTPAASMADAEGRFTFNGLMPGDYVLQAQRLGYEAAARRITIVAGEVAQADVVLQPIAIEEPRSVTFLADGFLGIEATPPGLFLRLNATGDDKRHFRYALDAGAVSAVNAITWQSSTPATAKRLDLQLYVGRGLCQNPCTLSGRSMNVPPVVVRNDTLMSQTDGDTGHGILTFFGLAPCWYIENGTNFNSCTSHPDALAQVAYQQRIHVATSIFYLQTAPPGYNPLQK